MSNILLKLAKTNVGLLSKVPSSLINNIISKLNFSPPNITTKGLWLDSSDTSPTNIVNSNGLVSQWSDKFGNGRHATQPSSGNRPLTGVDQKAGKNVISFDRGNAMEIDYLVPEDDFSVFIVAKSVFSRSFDFYFGQGTGGAVPEIDWGFSVQNTGFYYGSLNAGSIGAGSPPTAPDPVIMNLTNSRSVSTNTFLLYKNNKAFGPVSREYANAATTITLGRRLEGWIAEVIIYEKLLSDTERNQVYNYLNNKWLIA